MPDETVSVNIETELKGANDVESFIRSLNGLDAIKASGLNNLEVSVKRVEAATKSGIKTTETYIARTKTAGESTDQLAEKQARAAIAAQNLATAQQRAATSAQNAASAQVQAGVRQEKAIQAVTIQQERAAVAAQNLANAQVRASAASVSAANANVTATSKAAQSQAQLGINATKLSTAAAKAKFDQDQLSQKIQNSSVQVTEHENRVKRAEVAANRLALQEEKLANATQAYHAKLAAVNPQIEAHQKALNSVASTAQSLGGGLRSAGAALTIGLTAPIVLVGKESLDAAIKMDSFKRGLTAVAGSSELANQELKDLRKIAELPGIGFPEAIQGAIRLQAVGFNSQTAERALKAFANAVALTGGGAPELERVTIQLSQMASKGKVLTQDLRPIIEAAPAVGTALKKAFGTVNAEDIEKLHLSTEDFFNQLFTALENGPKADENSVANQLENLRTDLFLAANAIGQALLPALISLVKTAGPLLEQFAATFAGLSPAIQQIIVIAAGVLAVAGPILVIVGSLVGAFGTLLSAVSAALPFLTGFGGVVIELIGAIGSGGLVAAVEGLAGAVGGGLTAAFAALSEVILPAIAAILAIAAIAAVVAAAVAAAAYLIYRVWTENIGGVQQLVERAFNTIKETVFSILAQLKAEWDKILPLLLETARTILDAIAAFWAKWGDTIIGVVTVAFNLVRTLVKDAIQYISGIIRLILAVINGDWAAAWQALKDIVSAAFEAIITYISAIVGVIVKLIIGLVKAIAATAVEWVKAGIALIQSMIGAIIDFIVNSPTYIVQAFKYLFTQAIFDLGGFLFGIGKKAWDFIKAGFTGQAVASPLPAVAPPTAPAPTDAGATVVDTRPNAFGRGTGGGKTKTKKERQAPIDALEKAQIETARATERQNNAAGLADLEYSYKQRLVAVTDYYTKLTGLRDADLKLDVDAANEKVKLAQKELAAPKLTDKREIDKLQANLEEANRALKVAQTKREESRLKTLREEFDAIEDIRKEYVETEKTLLEVTGQFAKADSLAVSEEFSKRIERVTKNLEGARIGLANAQVAGDQKAIDFYTNLVSLLSAQSESINKLKTQTELNNQFKQDQRDLAEIERKRGLALDELNRTLAETGATEDVATAARRDLMKQYQVQIDAVIARLKQLAAAGLLSPELKKTIDDLQNQRSETLTVPIDERANEAQRRFEKIMAERQRQLDLNDLQQTTDLDKEQQRLQIVAEYNDKLKEQLGIWGQIEAQRQGGPSEAFKDATVQVKKANEATVNFGLTLKNAAFGSAITNLVDLFTNLGQGAKSFGQAALDALGSFVKLIQQIVIQILLLRTIQAITGIPVAALLKFMGGGFAAGGMVSGKGQKSGGLFGAALRGFATGGALQVAPTGFLRGPGGPRQDKITAIGVSPGEFILDAETTSNIGPEVLYSILHSKGRLLQGFYAEGGGVGTAINNIAAAPEGAGGANVNFTALNYFGKKDVHEVISDYFGSSEGGNLFVNLMRVHKRRVNAQLNN